MKHKAGYANPIPARSIRSSTLSTSDRCEMFFVNAAGGGAHGQLCWDEDGCRAAGAGRRWVVGGQQIRRRRTAASVAGGGGAIAAVVGLGGVRERKGDRPVASTWRFSFSGWRGGVGQSPWAGYGPGWTRATGVCRPDGPIGTAAWPKLEAMHSQIPCPSCCQEI